MPGQLTQVVEALRELLTAVELHEHHGGMGTKIRRDAAMEQAHAAIAGDHDDDTSDGYCSICDEPL